MIIVSIDQSDVFGIDLHADGQQTGKLHQQTFDPGTSNGKERPLVTIERTAHNADAAIEHGGSYLFRQVVLGIIRHTDGMNETFHIGIGHHHRFPKFVPYPAILKGRDAFDYRIERLTSVVNKQQIGDAGNFPPDRFSFHHAQPPLHGRKHRDVPFLKEFVSRLSGIGPFKVAHHKPTGFVHAFGRKIHFSCPDNSKNPASHRFSFGFKQLQKWRLKVRRVSSPFTIGIFTFQTGIDSGSSLSKR